MNGLMESNEMIVELQDINTVAPVALRMCRSL